MVLNRGRFSTASTPMMEVPGRKLLGQAISMAYMHLHYRGSSLTIFRGIQIAEARSSTAL